jgi:two-component system NtrC family sensor kinase
MLKRFALSTGDQRYRTQLRETLVEDLYRRAPLPLLLFIPILYALYHVVEDAVQVRPAIAWVFVGMMLVLLPRIVLVLLVHRIKARWPDPRVRIAIFATAAALLGIGLATVNIMAAPVLSPEQLALLVIIGAGINSIAIVSMSPSLASYLLYMVPNIASMAVAVMIGPPLQHGGILLFLICLNLFSLIVMATYVHLSTRKAILLRLRVADANDALRDSNARLENEIGERTAAERALRERNVELEVANRRLAEAHSQLLQSEKLASVGQLAAGIAHEINNPISFVHSNLHSLGSYTRDMFNVLDAYEQAGSAHSEAALRRAEQLKTSANVDFLRSDIPTLINESSDGLTRVEKIIKDLREFTNIDRSERQLVDVHDALERTLSVAAHEIRPKADVVREYGELPLIDCRPAQLNQVFLALLINAAQAIETRGTITLRTAVEGEYVRIAVSDTGKGIEAAHLGRLFDPFFTTRPVGSGVGLGLTVAYNIVQQHGGRIEVASTPGTGATFTVHLPLRASESK